MKLTPQLLKAKIDRTIALINQSVDLTILNPLELSRRQAKEKSEMVVRHMKEKRELEIAIDTLKRTLKDEFRSNQCN